jgi:sirohydrochlorin cobaltochelatase
MQHRFILLAHGSLDPAWRQPFIELTGDLQSRLGTGAIRLAFMEFVPPSLVDAAREAARDGAPSLSVLPVFLAVGAHLSKDIPLQIEEARMQFPTLRIELLPPIAADRRVEALFRQIVCEQFARRAAVMLGADQ